MNVRRVMTQKKPAESGTESDGDLDAWIQSIEERERWLSEHFQALSQYLLVEQEEERRKLSRILHDRIGQSLTAAIINLQTAQMSGGHLDEDMLTQTCQTLSDCLSEVREMALNLRPSQLDELGLKLTVEAYLQRVLTSGQEQYKLQAEGLPERFEPDLETNAFRIIQDVISLCRRQAKPFHLDLDLRVEGDELRLNLAYRFAGPGSETCSIEEKHFLGVRERTAMLGGECSIETSGEQGRVQASLPLNPENGR